MSTAPTVANRQGTRNTGRPRSEQSRTAVLDATRNLYNAKRQQAEAGYNFLLDGLKLKQAAGTLSAADIAVISQQML